MKCPDIFPMRWANGLTRFHDRFSPSTPVNSGLSDGATLRGEHLSLPSLRPSLRITSRSSQDLPYGSWSAVCESVGVCYPCKERNTPGPV